MIAFRLYGLSGCPHCADAELFFMKKGIMQRGAVQSIVCNGDPIATLGINKVLGTENPEYPVLVSFLTNPVEVVRGFNQEVYERLAEVFIAMYGGSGAGTAQPQGDTAGQATVVAQPEAPPVNGAAAMPNVHGGVDGASGNGATVAAG